MAPVWRNNGTASGNAGPAVTISPGNPTGMKVDDLDFMYAYVDADTLTITANGGGAWTGLTGSPFAGGSGDKLYIWYRTSQSGDTAPTITSGAGLAAGDAFIGIRFAVKGGTFDPVQPIGVIGTANSGASGSRTNTGVTTVLDQELALILVGESGAGTDSGWQFDGSITGVTERIDQVTTSGNDASIGMAEKTITPAGATGSAQSSSTIATVPWISLTVSLRPWVTHAAFPKVETIASGSESADTTTHPLTYPSGVSTDDMLVAVFCTDGTPTLTWPSGWTSLDNGTVATMRLEVRYRIAAGGESGTFNVTTSASEQASWAVLRISNHDVSLAPEIAAATGGDLAPNSPSLTPSWGADNNLWLSIVGMDGSFQVSDFPAGYNFIVEEDSNVGNPGTLLIAQKEDTSATEDPLTWSTVNFESWRALTLAIPPPQGTPTIEPGGASGSRTTGGPALSNVAPQTLTPGGASGLLTAGGVTLSKVQALNVGGAVGSASAGGPSLAAPAPQSFAVGGAAGSRSAGGPALDHVQTLEPGGAAGSLSAGGIVFSQPPAQTLTVGGAVGPLTAGGVTLGKPIAPGGAVGNSTAGGVTLTKVIDTPEDAPFGDIDAIPPEPGDDFLEAWGSANQVTLVRPHMVVEVRRGRWHRGYRGIGSGEVIGANIPADPGVDRPWMAYWSPTTDWEELPGVLSCNLEQNFEQNGQVVVTLVAENTRLQPAASGAVNYHVFERGYLAPDRGYTAPGRGQAGGAPTEWEDDLSRKAQVRIWMGYGEPQRGALASGSTMPLEGGTNGGWAFIGQVDDIDLDSQPDRITITCRTGHTLTDSRIFGWNKSPRLDDPITFTSQDDPAYDPSSQWIQVADVTDMVRVALRWAGFREWSVETAGVGLKGHITFNRSNYLIDIINKAMEMLAGGAGGSWVFYMDRPVSGDRLAIPTFRANRALLSQAEWEASPPAQTMQEVTEDDLLTSVSLKQTEEPLAYIIRVRGKATAAGVPLGGDSTERLMAVYRPPWSYQPGEGGPDRLGGLIKHQITTLPRVNNLDDLEIAARIIALREALQAWTATVRVPGNYAYCLDAQIGVVDTTSAIDSRLWIAHRSMEFQTGAQTRWVSNIAGPLLDTEDIIAILAELEEFE